MERTGQREMCLALLLLVAVCAQGVFVEPPQLVTSQRSLAESETRLPCRYQVEDEEKVVQVTWFKELPDGSKEQIITAHFTDGHTEFGRYSGRVRFESGSPTENSALLIPSTEESDEGSYTCHISTFPNGNFREAHHTHRLDCTHLLPGACFAGGGPVVPFGSLLSSRGSPASPSLLGHGSARPVPEPHQ
ncbi:hypothetical protein D5F01_LYC10174 [Larimichthys crocea]|uniref:Ig-like domain-containing protein n=1 Tax=Larimichthys crocea TaxID=215358 RepID=A0A6G0IGB6_LARCR|nr:hypothetical protein D5F01_LYC10174 [Larimichthys crocea]